MNEQTFNSVMLSVISSPASSGIVYSRGVSPNELMGVISRGGHRVQEHLAGIYGTDPFSAAEGIISRCESSGVSIITVWDDLYPPLLREIYMPPLVLYCRGEIIHGRHVSIVGTRGSDRLSDEITRRIGAALAGRNIIVTSGLALGIDRSAHLGALLAGGSTIAVLPLGIDVISPRANTDVYLKIIASKGSAVISELPPGIKSGEPWVFVRRNRIISGISEAVIITQAPVKSGAMITANYAIEQNRDLYVCPGNAFDESYGGCHHLIKQGAAIISDIDGFLSDIDPLNYVSTCGKDGRAGGAVETLPGAGINMLFEGIERIVMEAASASWADVDETARSSNLPVDEINRAVTMLEIEGHIIRKGNRIRAVNLNQTVK